MRIEYIADDGTRFKTEQDCLDYENLPRLIYDKFEIWDYELDKMRSYDCFTIWCVEQLKLLGDWFVANYKLSKNRAASVINEIRRECIEKADKYDNPFIQICCRLDDSGDYGDYVSWFTAESTIRDYKTYKCGIDLSISNLEDYQEIGYAKYTQEIERLDKKKKA